MATEMNCLSSGKKFTTGVDNSVFTPKSQFTNLNLNQSHKCIELSTVHSKCISSNDKCKQNYASPVLADPSFKNGSCFNSKNNFLNKTRSNSLSSKYANLQGKLLNQKDKHQKTGDSKISSSTLSLHIAAYENNIEAAAADAIDNKSIHDFGQHQKTFKQIVNCSISQDPYEFPRQQKENDGSKPESMQFKSSQKLLDPNHHKAAAAETKMMNKINAEFEKFTKTVEKLLKVEEYKNIVNSCCRFQTQFSDKLSDTQIAEIFAYRSEASSSLKDEKFMMAKSDAESIIRLRADWWKGYYCMGRAQVGLGEWREAEESLAKAMSLKPESKELKDKTRILKDEIGYISREKYPYSNFLRSSTDDPATIPGLFETLQGLNYRDGVNGSEQNDQKAFECFTKAVEHEIPFAMFRLGIFFQNGFQEQKNLEEAFKWLYKAATSASTIMNGSGIAEAQHLLGLNYSEGVGVDKDFRKAAEWYEKAVANGCAASENNLGLFYQHGKGVEKSLSKAFEYFKSAAEKDEIPGMFNLAKCYFNADGSGSLIPTSKDISEGEKWLHKAAEKGDARATDELKYRIKSAVEKDLLYSFGELVLKRSILNYEKFGNCIEEAAKNGSSTAQRHLNIWRYFGDALKAFKKSDSKAVVSALSKAIHLDLQIVKLPDFFKPIIEERFKTHPNELDTIICYVQINANHTQSKLLALESWDKFGKDEFLAEMAYTCGGILKDSRAPLRVAGMALGDFPNSLRIKYVYAMALCQQNDQQPECLKALDAFLAVAPKDHDKVPACHYRKAMYYKYHEDYSNFMASFEAGLAAEKEQLPCFLPYFFPTKSFLEALYKAKKEQGVTAPTPLNLQFERIKNDERRKLMIKNNREKFDQLVESIDTTNIDPNSTMPKNTTKIPSTKKLKKITLEEMDRINEKVYDGFVLDGRIIDWAVRENDIEIIIEDENRHGQRVSISNWPSTGIQIHDVSNALKTFAPNYKISIINPSIKSTSDGSDEIQVRGPEFIKIEKTSGDQQKCHCCGNENEKIFACSGCLMAKYCSKECQKFDWIELNHKGICKHLKIFAKMM